MSPDIVDIASHNLPDTDTSAPENTSLVSKEQEQEHEQSPQNPDTSVNERKNLLNVLPFVVIVFYNVSGEVNEKILTNYFPIS